MEDERLEQIAKSLVDWFNGAAPFYFIVELDEEEVEKRGWNMDALLSCVDKYASERGMTRTDRNRWDSLSEDFQKKQSAYHRTLLCLSMRRWFMETVKSWTAFDSEAPLGSDYLDTCRKYPLKMI